MSEGNCSIDCWLSILMFAFTCFHSNRTPPLAGHMASWHEDYISQPPFQLVGSWDKVLANEMWVELLQAGSRSPSAEMAGFLKPMSLLMPLLHFVAQNMDVMARAMLGWQGWQRYELEQSYFLKISWSWHTIPSFKLVHEREINICFIWNSVNLTNFLYWICKKIDFLNEHIKTDKSKWMRTFKIIICSLPQSSKFS